MESRKIQKVGAATFTVSLPKEWVGRRNLRKGDQVFLVEDGEGLRLLPNPAIAERDREGLEFTIDADLCTEPGMLERIIVGNYVLGRERLVVQSKKRLASEHQNEIRQAIRRLMGIGIIEENGTRVVLQCSIDPANYPLDALIKRLYNLGATMLVESLEALETGVPALAEDAIKREDDADMMYWLILRLVLSAQMDEGLVEPLGMRSKLEIAGYRLISKDLETVADLSHDIALNVKFLLGEGIRVPAPVLKMLTEFASALETGYAKALGGLLSRDLKQANEAIHFASGLEKRELDFVRLVLREMKDPKAILPVRTICTNMARIGGFAGSIAVIAFNRYLEKPTDICRPTEPGEARVPALVA